MVSRARLGLARVRLGLGFKALKELGPRQVGLYALYQLGLRSGYFAWATRSARDWRGAEPLILRSGLFPLPDAQELRALLGEPGQAQVLALADEVVRGNVRLFGAGKAVALRLAPAGPLVHWTRYETGGQQAGTASSQGEVGDATSSDVKFTWEPARFGWAYLLARAYRLSGDERYAAAFWEHTQAFLQANPPYLGPHWTSAQEVALRLIALVFAWGVFKDSQHSTPPRAAQLAQAVAAHADRIPPTLLYARAQNNNHLLSEAAGLYTAALALPGHPQAHYWGRLGWRWFERGLQMQIAEDGAYIQHSANYHRLMLQLAVWVDCLGRSAGRVLSDTTQARLEAATRWLLALVDPASGGAPNLGPNDGAYILPLTVCPFADYRPALQAAALVFWGQPAFAVGPWDEISLWLGLRGQGQERIAPSRIELSSCTPHVLRSPGGDSWAYLRAARFSGRPGHADQLHLDLWWRGLNVAQDAGTYLYNAPPPWDNALAGTAAHNTLVVAGRDQMQRAGRFLYLDWAQAQVLSQSEHTLVAQHDGYRRLGLFHRRSVSLTPVGDWLVQDSLLPLAHVSSHPQPCLAALHWLFPDWPWNLEEVNAQEVLLELSSPLGWVKLHVTGKAGLSDRLAVQVVRAGELLYGVGEPDPTRGWSSATYGDKIPALSVRICAQGALPLELASQFTFAKSESSR
ncbi:MAG: alginate lyase family protein [Chloroflexota bacterium]